MKNEIAKYAFEYYRVGLVPVFLKLSGVPMHDWRAYAERGISAEELRALVVKYGGEARRLAVATGPYQRDSGAPWVIVDVDSIDVPREEAMTVLAREGFQVVETARGFHVRFRLARSDAERPPYMVVLYREDAERRREHVAEGGVLFPHLWTSPPSVKRTGGGWVRYRFVLPDGRRVYKFEEYARYRELLEPQTFTLPEAISTIELVTGASSHVKFEPGEANIRGVSLHSAIEGGGRSPVWTDFDSFYASIPTMPVLPACAAWVLYHYAMEIGDSYTAGVLAGLYGQFLDITRKVPHGMRFLVAAAVALFLAHVIEWVRLDEILAVLAAGVEDWPADEGATLDRKIRYLLLVSEDGYVYPRYSGLGSITPALRMDCESVCPLARACRGRKPWRPYVRLYGWAEDHGAHEMLKNLGQG